MRGMTLVELVVVLSLVGLLAVVAVPRFTGRDAVEMQAAVRRVAADLRWAQARAIATRVRHGVTFDPAAGRYTVYRDSPATPADDFLRPGSPMRRDVAPAAMVAADFDGAPRVEFDSMGVPYGVSGELTAPGRVILAGGGEVDTVVVEPLTGRVGR